MTYVLTGRYPLGSLDGRPGVLKFVPSTTIVGDGNVVLPAPVVVRLDADGAFSQALVGTNDPAYQPAGLWVWTVSEQMTGGRDPWSFELTADSDISDLATVATPSDPSLYVPITRTLTAGDGLTGGGTLAANRTFAVGAGTGISVAADAVSVDPAALDLADFASGAATDGYVATADGAGGVAWEAVAGGGGAVDSVNGYTGTVVLDNTDVGAAATSHAHTLADVSDAGGAAALDVGTTAGTVAAGDDSRLSDDRDPTAHAASHAVAGSDPVTVAQSQVTNLTADLAAHNLRSGAQLAYPIGAANSYGLPGAQHIAQATQAVATNRVAGGVFIVTHAVSVTEIAVIVNVAAATGGALGRAAIYDVADFKAAPLAWTNGRDAGTFAIDSTGTKVAAFGTPQTLQPGVYGIAVAVNGAATLGVANQIGGLAITGSQNTSNAWRGPGQWLLTAGGTALVSGGMTGSLSMVIAATVAAANGQPAPALLTWSYV